MEGHLPHMRLPKMDLGSVPSFPYGPLARSKP